MDVFSRLLAIFLTLHFTTYLSWPDWLYFYKKKLPLCHYASCYVPLMSLSRMDKLLSTTDIVCGEYNMQEGRKQSHEVQIGL